MDNQRVLFKKISTLAFPANHFKCVGEQLYKNYKFINKVINIGMFMSNFILKLVHYRHEGQCYKNICHNVLLIS